MDTTKHKGKKVSIERLEGKSSLNGSRTAGYDKIKAHQKAVRLKMLLKRHLSIDGAGLIESREFKQQKVNDVSPRIQCKATNGCDKRQIILMEEILETFKTTTKDKYGTEKFFCPAHQALSGNIAHLSDFTDYDGGYVHWCGEQMEAELLAKTSPDGELIVGEGLALLIVLSSTMVSLGIASGVFLGDYGSHLCDINPMRRAFLWCENTSNIDVICSKWDHSNWEKDLYSLNLTSSPYVLDLEIASSSSEDGSVSTYKFFELAVSELCSIINSQFLYSYFIEIFHFLIKDMMQSAPSLFFLRQNT
ncbi:hypothetical protein Tco_0953844 [Tanacetum coccineum]|uniref:Uncharacterized protein n=1 Tax=Tanacetum coccineum TaxID=301880 RepID=A0ABQ5E4B0_9ASTR